MKTDRQDKFLDEIKRCVTDPEVLAKVQAMDNTIAELEEEKGNLQLRLVDYEELSAAEASAKQEAKELSDRITLQDEMLESHLTTITHLESEKLDLTELVKDRDADLGKTHFDHRYTTSFA